MVTALLIWKPWGNFTGASTRCSPCYLGKVSLASSCQIHHCKYTHVSTDLGRAWQLLSSSFLGCFAASKCLFLHTCNNQDIPSPERRFKDLRCHLWQGTGSSKKLCEDSKQPFLQLLKPSGRFQLVNFQTYLPGEQRIVQENVKKPREKPCSLETTSFPKSNLSAAWLSHSHSLQLLFPAAISLMNFFGGWILERQDKETPITFPSLALLDNTQILGR